LKIGKHCIETDNAQTEHNIHVATSMSSFMLQHFVLLHHRAEVALKLQTAKVYLQLGMGISE